MQGYQADELFFRYKVERAFAKNGMGGFVEYDHAYGPDCTATLRWDPKSNEPYQFRPDLFPNYKGPDKVWQCATRQDVNHPEWRFRLETRETYKRDYLNPQVGIKWRVTDEKTGANIAVETALIKTLPIVQTLIAGCFLSASTWQCEVSLWPSSAGIVAGYKQHTAATEPGYDPESFPVSAVGRVLSLEPRFPNKR
jgi:hypothetical protein